jgi:hypothetical protein
MHIVCVYIVERECVYIYIDISIYICGYIVYIHIHIYTSLLCFKAIFAHPLQALGRFGVWTLLAV